MYVYEGVVWCFMVLKNKEIIKYKNICYKW